MATLRRTAVALGVLAVTLLLCAPAEADTTLYGWDTLGENLWTIDAAMPPSATFIGGGHPVMVAEIEYDGVGTIYGSDTSDNTFLHLIDPGTGAITDTLTMTFPGEGNVITSMEFVGDTLYAGLTTGGGGPTYLSTIDLGSGSISVIGATGVGSPFGGLAYEAASGEMYAISAGGSGGELFTVSLGSGTATSVGMVTVDGVDAGNLTALEFGADGELYSCPAAFGSAAVPPGHLLRIDPSSAAAVDLGDTGVSGLVALTTPEPSTLALLGAAGLFGFRRRR